LIFCLPLFSVIAFKEIFFPEASATEIAALSPEILSVVLAVWISPDCASFVAAAGLIALQNGLTK